MTTRKTATVTEVAQRAGVSIATVSRVTRGVGQVSAKTRARVQRAVDALGYTPNHLGRALAEQRHMAWGIVFPGLSGPYYSEVIRGFEQVALEAQQSVLILGTYLLEHSDAQLLAVAARVDGLAVMGGAVSDEVVCKLAAQGVPVVLLARQPIGSVAAVRVENQQSVAELTRHLLVAHGYRELEFIGNPQGSPDITARWEGFVAAHRSLGLTPPAQPLRVGSRQTDGVIAVTQLSAAGRWPRALVCANDEIALGVYSALTAKGLRIPEDVAVTGFDDIPMARLLEPQLTTVVQPMIDLGETAAKLLRDRLRGTPSPTETVLPTRLLLRQSCGCSRAPPVDAHYLARSEEISAKISVQTSAKTPQESSQETPEASGDDPAAE